MKTHERIHVLLDSDKYWDLRMAAVARRTTLSNIVRQLVCAWLAEPEMLKIKTSVQTEDSRGAYD